MTRWAAMAVWLGALPCHAETGYSCAFTVACHPGAECEPASEEAEIAIGAQGQWIFLGEAGAALPAERLSRLGAATQVYSAHLDDVASTLLTINPDGTALRSRHEGGREAVTFFGTCAPVG